MIALFGLVLLLALLSIPFGVPGIWIMIAAALGMVWLSPVGHAGWLVIGGCVAIALASEILDFVFASRYTKKYGGSNRAAWGAIIGGIVGAVVGVPIPIIGPIVGAIGGSFLGALAFELTTGAPAEGAARAATGAAIGRTLATATKVGAGVVIAVILLAAVVFQPSSGVLAARAGILPT